MSLIFHSCAAFSSDRRAFSCSRCPTLKGHRKKEADAEPLILSDILHQPPSAADLSASHLTDPHAYAKAHGQAPKAALPDNSHTNPEFPGYRENTAQGAFCPAHTAGAHALRQAPHPPGWAVRRRPRSRRGMP